MATSAINQWNIEKQVSLYSANIFVHKHLFCRNDSTNLWRYNKEWEHPISNRLKNQIDQPKGSETVTNRINWSTKTNQENREPTTHYWLLTIDIHTNTNANSAVISNNANWSNKRINRTAWFGSWCTAQLRPIRKCRPVMAGSAHSCLEKPPPRSDLIPAPASPAVNSAPRTPPGPLSRKSQPPAGHVAKNQLNIRPDNQPGRQPNIQPIKKTWPVKRGFGAAASRLLVF